MTTQLMRPITYFGECRTCGKPWAGSSIDADGNGPCCHTTKLMDSTDLMHLELAKIKARLESLTEQNRLLLQANKELGQWIGA